MHKLGQHKDIQRLQYDDFMQQRWPKTTASCWHLEGLRRQEGAKGLTTVV